MDPVTIGMTMLGHAGKYLLDNGGKDIVNKAANDLYSWVKGKFTKPAQKEKIDALKADPDNKQVREDAKKLLDSSLDFDAIDEDELTAAAKSFEQTILKDHPEWLANSGVKIKNNSIVIEGDKNIAIQDVKDSDININIG